jgi:hypothetical protein
LAVSRRTPVLVIGLTVGDYLLWNWSLNSSHDVIALASGLTLPPLVLVSVWVLALGAIQGIAAIARLARGGRLRATPRFTARSADARTRAARERRSAPATGRRARAAARGRSGNIAA